MPAIDTTQTCQKCTLHQGWVKDILYGCELDQFVLAVKLELVTRTPVYPVYLKFAVTGYIYTNFSIGTL